MYIDTKDCYDLYFKKKNGENILILPLVSEKTILWYLKQFKKKKSKYFSIKLKPSDICKRLGLLEGSEE
jgi:argonaute-like protein implicated in RNA metabolism and viral defense